MFYINWAIGFPLLFSIRLGGFLLSTNSHIYTFNGAYTKKKGNCNAMVTRPAITWPFITASINCSLRYNLLVSFYTYTLYQISTSFLKEGSLTCPKNYCRSSWMLEYKLARKLLADQCLSYSDTAGARVVAHTLQSHCKNHRSGERKKLPRCSQHNSWDINISFS